MKLRNFTESDWSTFAGCETPSPKIGEIEFEIFSSDYRTYVCTLIVDGDTVTLNGVNKRREINYMDQTWSRTFEKMNWAEEFARGFHPSEQICEADLKALWGFSR